MKAEETIGQKSANKLKGEHKTVSLFIDNAKTYIQLSTGALVLSVTFIQGLLGSKDVIPVDALMMIPWICWLLAILSGVTYQYSAAKYLEKLEEEYGNLIYHRVKENWLLRSLVKNPYRVYGFMMVSFYFGTLFFTTVAIVKLMIKVIRG